MNRSLTIDRLYTLGEYRNIRVSDTINDIPEELMLNEDVVDAIRKVQLLSLDIVHQKYLQLAADLSKYKDGSPERYNALLALRDETMEDLRKLLTNKE